ncbi:MAG: ATP-binding protein [Candidatus Latescibacterota bacterium]
MAHVIPRTLERYLRRDATLYPIVALTGPRQAGKTTLARAAFPGHAYVSLEETENRLLARDDPRGFLARLPGDAIVEEAQRAPNLFSYIQTAVDAVDRPGRFVLTGSQNFLLMEQVSQSLAGRCGLLHVLPFSRAELERQEQPEPSLDGGLFANRSTGLDCWATVWSGLYPRIHDRQIPPQVWLADYVRTYIERDVRELVNVGDLDTFERFVALCTGRTGQILNYSALANDCGIAVDTARRWISTLRTSFIVFLLRPHSRNFSKRLIKSPKLYFYDTGLVCYLLGIRSREQLLLHAARGAVFENYVVAEVNKQFVHHRQESPLFFWRDQTGHEIDLLIDTGSELLAVEVKSAETINPSMLDGLVW